MKTFPERISSAAALVAPALNPTEGDELFFMSREGLDGLLRDAQQPATNLVLGGVYVVLLHSEGPPAEFRNAIVQGQAAFAERKSVPQQELPAPTGFMQQFRRLFRRPAQDFGDVNGTPDVVVEYCTKGTKTFRVANESEAAVRKKAA
jgi:hypothetical protein